MLPESKQANSIMVLTVAMMLVFLTGQVFRGTPAIRMLPRNDLTRWSMNPATGAPRYLEAVAADAAPFSRTVYATDPFAAELTPAFGHQYVLFYDFNANPAVDTRGRALDWTLLGDPQVPLAQRRAILRERGIGYIILTRAEPERAASVASLMRGKKPIYDDGNATVWRVD